MVLEDPGTRQVIEIPKEGMLVSLKCAENHKLGKGSVLEIMGNDGNIRKITFQGAIEHYLGYNLFVVSDSYYEEVMGEKADLCVFLLNGNAEGLYEQVKHIEGFLSLLIKEVFYEGVYNGSRLYGIGRRDVYIICIRRGLSGIFRGVKFSFVNFLSCGRSIYFKWHL